MTNNVTTRIDDINDEIAIKTKTSQLLDAITETDAQISTALRKADLLKSKANEKHSAGYSWAGKEKRLAIEALQSVTRDMADSQAETLQIIQLVVEDQKKLNQHTTILYQLGAMSLAANRMVHRELKMKLENASENELSELAQQELLNTVRQLEQMQDTLSLQEKQKAQLKQQSEQISTLKEENECLRQAISQSKFEFANIAKEQERHISAINLSLNKFVEDANAKQKKSQSDIDGIKIEVSQQSIDINNQKAQLSSNTKITEKLNQQSIQLASEISKLETMCTSKTAKQDEDISELHTAIEALSEKLSNWINNVQTYNDSLNEEIKILKNFSYSKNKVLLIFTCGVLLSLVLGTIGYHLCAPLI